jgi:hypothetical protein
MITAQGRAFFKTFGYLRLPGLLRDEIGWITEAFMATVRDEFSAHCGQKRRVMQSCLERSERLRSLLDLQQLSSAKPSPRCWAMTGAPAPATATTTAATPAGMPTANGGAAPASKSRSISTTSWLARARSG